MAWSGSSPNGAFSRVHDWTDDEGAALNIEAARMDAEDDSFQVGINLCIHKGGLNAATGDLPMGSNRHTGVANANAKNTYASAADVMDQDLLYYVDSGSADTYVITPSPSAGALEEGQKHVIRIANTNTGASTLNVNALGAVTIRTQNGLALQAGALIAGAYYEITYDANGSRYLLTSPHSSYVQVTDSGGSDFGLFTHDGTDLNLVGTNTTDWNISGITVIQAGGVNADFAAITGTSYGGITEANLVDKAATEAVSGAWTFSGGLTVTTSPIVAGSVAADFGAVTATSYGGITEANLVDKAATEAVSGAWTFSGGVTFTTSNIVAGTVDADFDAVTATSYGGIVEGNLVDKSATEAIAGAWTFNGAIVFSSTIDLGAAALNGGSCALTTDNDSADELDFKGMPQNAKDISYTLVLADAGRCIYKAAGGAGETITIDSNANVAWPVGTVIEIINQGGGTLSLAITSDVLTQLGTGNTGTRTIADDGSAVIRKVTATSWVVSGAGLT